MLVSPAVIDIKQAQIEKRPQTSRGKKQVADKNYIPFQLLTSHSQRRTTCDAAMVKQKAR